MMGMPGLLSVVKPWRVGAAYLAVSVVLCATVIAIAVADTPARGKVTGGVPHRAPDWFKSTFLDIAEDVDEASAADKHLMLFFQLNDCPYCDRMLTECFETEPLTGFIQAHFDVIAINVRGDREVVFNEQVTLLEKELAESLRVRATPAILFLDKDNRQVVRVNGYRSPIRFQQILNYVSSKSYRDAGLADYLERNLADDAYTFRDHTLFQDISDLSAAPGPLAVIFEDTSCYDCAEFHDRLLADEGVVAELRRFTVVRLDADSEHPIVDPAGKPTTPRQLARDHQMTYRPGILLFDSGRLVRRHDSLAFVFHFTESLHYVGGGFHRSLEYREFSDRYREELLSSGVTIDFSK